MKKIYLVTHKPAYGESREIKRAFESKLDADDLVHMMAEIVRGELVIEEAYLEPAKTYSRDPAPQPPRFLGSPDPTPKAALP